MDDYKITSIPIPPSDSDIDEQRKLRLLALQTDPSSFGSTYEREAAFTREIWRERLESPLKRTFIARYSPKNVLSTSEDLEPERSSEWIGGLVIMAPGAVSIAIPHTDPKTSFLMFGMWVHPDHRGKGVGRMLLEGASGWAREYAKTNAMDEFDVVLEVYRNNLRARGECTGAGLI